MYQKTGKGLWHVERPGEGGAEPRWNGPSALGLSRILSWGVAPGWDGAGPLARKTRTPPHLRSIAPSSQAEMAAGPARIGAQHLPSPHGHERPPLLSSTLGIPTAMDTSRSSTPSGHLSQCHRRGNAPHSSQPGATPQETPRPHPQGLKARPIGIVAPLHPSSFILPSHPLAHPQGRLPPPNAHRFRWRAPPPGA
jgi:hypothetical protein